MVKTYTIILETCRQITIENSDPPLPTGTPLFIRAGTYICIASQRQAAAWDVYGLMAGMR